MKVWSGSVSAGSLLLDGICLVDPSSSGQCKISKAKLSVRSLVDPTLIPLFALTGPVLEVHVSNAFARDWIISKVLRNIASDPTFFLDDDFCTTKQCPVGILLVVEHARNIANIRRVTDILIYGTLSLAASRPPQAQAAPIKELRLHAAPICSALIPKANSLLSPSLTADSDNTETAEYAEFLSDPFAPSPKRKRIDTLFEAANEYHNKVRRKGMIAVSEYMEKSREVSPMVQFPYLKMKRESQNDANAIPSAQSGHEKRRLSTAGGVNSSLSRQISAAPRLRSASVSSRKLTPLLSAPVKPPPILDNASAETTVSTNKALLTRTILTCLRLYGYHRTTNAARAKVESTSDATTTTKNPTTEPLQSTAEAEEEDEFKTMYHATYRASTFALRKYLNTKCPVPATKSGFDASSTKPLEVGTIAVPVLDKEKATDVVDAVLKIFCEEPG
ncbi:predicted protein [Uncinocarpus reesii 1704]|uniref:Sld7 C-terminal domain-containing protein n=1 Tax=Uncinocarpus reesii (strain UAMH 1704) TaxID=336963 RepID=C4JNY9_UNCRE|nr:uncharacterized protein UREG_03048 [Uncinocarpus reesii 1704]EEP78203.1 predicted protein [Uncinocarpus reesii 1704]